MIKKCFICNKDFFKKQNCSKKSWKKAKFCSKDCFGKFYSGNNNPSKRLSVRRKIAIKSSQKIGKLSSHWAGNNVGYHGVHIWLKKYWGKPSKCEHCEKDGLSGNFIVWANISGKYKRDRNDYKRLCAKCHCKYDNTLKKSWITRKKILP